MPFKQGDNKPINSGRKKGTLNKRSLEFINALEERGFYFIDEFLTLYEASDDIGKRSMLLRSVDYLYPKLKAIDLYDEEKEQVETIEDVLRRARK